MRRRVAAHRVLARISNSACGLRATHWRQLSMIDNPFIAAGWSTTYR
jgi:hypothetical protein